MLTKRHRKILKDSKGDSIDLGLISFFFSYSFSGMIVGNLCVRVFSVCACILCVCIFKAVVSLRVGSHHLQILINRLWMKSSLFTHFIAFPSGS